MSEESEDTKEVKEKQEAPHAHHHEHHHEEHHEHKHGHCSCSAKGHTHEEAFHKAKEEASEFKDKYLRALAEIENSRKRLTKEKYESQALVVQEVISSFLDPLDQMESALLHAEKAQGDVQMWAKGFEMLLQQFHRILESYNVISFSSLGSLFDPHRHEALETEERSDVPAGTILKEYKKGYKIGEKTLRPAKVCVSKMPIQQEASKQESVVSEQEQPKQQE